MEMLVFVLSEESRNVASSSHSVVMLLKSNKVFDVLDRQMIKEWLLNELLKSKQSGRGQWKSFS